VNSEDKLRVLLVSIVPPKNDCGVRIVMHRMFVERAPFELHVASNADFADDLLVHTPLRFSPALHRLRKSRFGPRLAPWITDYENFGWPLTNNTALDTAVNTFKPDVVLTLAECGLCHAARRTAERHGLPLAGLFLDWFPDMEGHYGHAATKRILSRRYRELYAACDLVFCTSEGMQEALGPHPNGHVIYPMPGAHTPPKKVPSSGKRKFRLVYVGSVQKFYGRMLSALIRKAEGMDDLEVIVVGPNADWPADLLNRSAANGTYLGFKPPEQAADVMASADALLVVMSFEEAHELFMRTSFTTKFLDYVAFGKPVIVWGPEYCSPVRVTRKHGGAVAVTRNDPEAIISACREIADNAAWREHLSQQATQLRQTLFDPDRIQELFVTQMKKLVRSRRGN
jgi:glycosyltransferase involved in cell wall biosynthesis